MIPIRNKNGKLICYVSATRKEVAIHIKDCSTTIRFLPNGKVSVTHHTK